MRSAHLVCLGAAADEDLVGLAKARQSAGDAEVRGNAEPARMRDAVAVDEGQVRRLRQFFQRQQQCRQFAVRQQAGDVGNAGGDARDFRSRSEEHTSELQSLMRISYAVFCLKKKKIKMQSSTNQQQKSLD